MIETVQLPLFDSEPQFNPTVKRKIAKFEFLFVINPNENIASLVWLLKNKLASKMTVSEYVRTAYPHVTVFYGRLTQTEADRILQEIREPLPCNKGF